MDVETLLAHITATLDGLDVLSADGDHYIYYDPDRTRDPARTQPFATIVTSDAHDQFSDLNRPGVYRLNLGIGPESFRDRFGAAPFPRDPAAVRAAGHDFTALDRLFPHPVYGHMFWVSILNPSPASLQALDPLLREAHARAARHAGRRPRPSADEPAPDSDER